MSGLNYAVFAAAHTAESTGMRVRVVIGRQPGAVFQLRDAAEAVGAEVSVKLTPTSAVGYFGAGRPADRVQPARTAEREPGERVTGSLA